MSDREEHLAETLVPLAQAERGLGLPRWAVLRLIEWDMLRAYRVAESDDLYILADSLVVAQRWLREQADLFSVRRVVADEPATYATGRLVEDEIQTRLHRLWDPEVAAIWMDSPNAHLDGQTPIQVLTSGWADYVFRAIDAEAQGAHAGGPPYAEEREWLWLDRRPHGWRRQLWIRGRKLTVGDVVGRLHFEQLTPAELAADLHLPVAAVQAAVGWASIPANAALIAEENARDDAVAVRRKQREERSLKYYGKTLDELIEAGPDVGDMTESEMDDLSN